MNKTKNNDKKYNRNAIKLKDSKLTKHAKSKLLKDGKCYKAYFGNLVNAYILKIDKDEFVNSGYSLEDIKEEFKRDYERLFSDNEIKELDCKYLSLKQSCCEILNPIVGKSE